MNYLIFYKQKLNSILPYFLIFFLFNLYSLSANAALIKKGQITESTLVRTLEYLVMTGTGDPTLPDSIIKLVKSMKLHPQQQQSLASETTKTGKARSALTCIYQSLCDTADELYTLLNNDLTKACLATCQLETIENTKWQEAIRIVREQHNKKSDLPAEVNMPSADVAAETMAALLAKSNTARTRASQKTTTETSDASQTTVQNISTLSSDEQNVILAASVKELTEHISATLNLNPNDTPEVQQKKVAQLGLVTTNILTIVAPIFTTLAEGSSTSTEPEFVLALMTELEKSLKENPATSDLSDTIILKLIELVNSDYDVSSLLTKNTKNKKDIKDHLVQAYQQAHKDSNDDTQVRLNSLFWHIVLVLEELFINLSKDGNLYIEDETTLKTRMQMHLYQPTINETKAVDARNKAEKAIFDEKTEAAKAAAEQETGCILPGFIKPAQRFSLYDTAVILNMFDDCNVSVDGIKSVLDTVHDCFLPPDTLKLIKKNHNALIKKLSSNPAVKHELLLNSFKPLLVMNELSSGEVYLRIADALFNTGISSDENRLAANTIINSIFDADIFVGKQDLVMLEKPKKGAKLSKAWTKFATTIEMLNHEIEMLNQDAS